MKQNSKNSEIFMNEVDLKKNGFTSPLFLKNIFLVKTNGRQKVCQLCEVPFEYSEETGNSSLKQHLKAKHPIKFNEIFNAKETDTAEENIEKNIDNSLAKKKKEIVKNPGYQPSIKEAFKTENYNSVIKNFALLKAIHGLPYRLFDSVYFKKAIESYRCVSSEKGIEINGRLIRKELDNLFITSKKNFISNLASPETNLLLAIDGWTNSRQNKVTNILLINTKMRETYFWNSIENDLDFNTAEWNFKMLFPLINELLQSGFTIIGLVMDNEPLNHAIFKLINNELPFFLHIPCSAHTIQIIVNDILALNPLSLWKEKADALINKCRNDKKIRIELKKIQKLMKPSENYLLLLKPTETRWSSRYKAYERVYRLKNVFFFRNSFS